ATFSEDPQLHQAALNLRGSATLKHIRFADGTISFHVKFGSGGLRGISFRQRGDSSDVLYFRPSAQCPVSNNCMQYTPRDHGVLEWDMNVQHQTRAPIRMGAWNHITLVVSGKRLAVFVNGGSTPALVVNDMKGAYPSGELKFRGAASFANLVITPGKTTGLPPDDMMASAHPDERFFRHWFAATPFVVPSRMSKQLDEKTGIAPRYNTMPPATSMSWRSAATDSDGVLNLTRTYGEAQTGHAIVGIWLKTQINSDRAQVKQVAIGWTREIWVFVNGKQVFASKNLWDIPGASKNPRGRFSLLNGTFALPLRKGTNKIAVMLDDNFAGGLQHFGWGLEMRLNDLKHTTWNVDAARHSM
ncbi:MAG: family 16 glycoside hydrolase, partial [Candidatus Binataceae bacterium]